MVPASTFFGRGAKPSLPQIIFFTFFPLALSSCSFAFPGWVPGPLKSWLRASLGVQDSSSVAQSVSSDEIDKKLPPNSVSVNQKILNEMVKTVFLRDPISPKEFSGLLDVLNQGASFEGVYNGLIHSTEYRQLEEKAKPALPGTLQKFAEEWTHLQLELPPEERAKLTAALALPIPAIESPQEGDADHAIATEGGVATPAPMPSYANREDERKAVQRAVEETFLRANAFTMKRVIGTEVFKVFSRKKTDRNVLADWYARFCVRIAERGIALDYPQREDEDPEFHREWAWNASTDRLQWEVLFRLHRVLNDSESKR
jgi:hypothetical protein